MAEWRRVRGPYKTSAAKGARLNLAEVRRAAGYTQDDLAEALGVTQASVARWERGVTDISLSNLIKVATLLEVAPSELILEGDGLTDDEREMLEWLRAHPSDQRVIRSTLRGLQEARKEFEHDN